ncbi:hypothetical protein ACFXPS_31045 [Nocardia sp. NPDC059091]|uniref:hypothetical protein n=1 Tax=Nocardia sp. NPDC059091 TaxID=3346724 RepID=UPI0036A56F1C
MYREHEEAMRSEFYERVGIGLTALAPGITDGQADEIYRRVGEFDRRWLSGPHAQEWAFLDAAYTDWRDQPQLMAKFVEDLRVNPTVYVDYGLTDVQRRSLDQARTIAHEHRCAIDAWDPPTQRLPIRRDR